MDLRCPETLDPPVFRTRCLDTAIAVIQSHTFVIEKLCAKVDELEAKIKSMESKLELDTTPKIPATHDNTVRCVNAIIAQLTKQNKLLEELKKETEFEFIEYV